MTDGTFSGLATGGPRDLGPGSRLGIYVLDEPLGRGGMGQVWKALDTHGQRSVAIKVLPSEFRGNDEAIAQVRGAFQAIHALTHQHIVKTIGLIDDPQSGPYVVMDYAPGVTLSRYARDHRDRQGSLPVARVIELLSPMAAALDYAHRKGVLHRDIKPQNILVQAADDLEIREVWLIDFGLAAEIRNTMTKHTNKSVDTRGTRPYMSPEQLRGKRAQWDGRTDQYALAVVVYELLSGHLPFDGDDDFILMHAILNEPAEPLAGQPDSVNAVLLRGLAKTRDELFESCTAFLAALDQATRAAPLTKLAEKSKPPSIGVQADLAEMLAQSHSRVEQAHDQARRAFDQHEYGQAVTLLEQVPDILRDAGLLRDARAKRDRQVELDRHIRDSVEGMKLKGLRPSVEEVLQLDPRREDMRRLLEQLARIAPAAQSGLMIGGAKAGERAVFILVGIEYAFRWCPPGKFTMGSSKSEAGRSNNEDQVQVELTKGFWMQETVVTQAMWSAVMGSQPWQGQGCVQEGENYPSTFVDWNGATEFCHRLAAATEKTGDLPSGQIVLPTEARWEYACRAGTATVYSFGNDPQKLGSSAWFDGNTSDERYAHEVGQKQPNPWGLLDMHGNVWEWCSDGYNQNLADGRDPVGPSRSSRVLRGGSWNTNAINARCSNRNDNDPARCNGSIGFRVIVSW